MKEKTLFRVSVGVALAGLLFLFFYADTLELTAVERLDSALPEETVVMHGLVTRLSKQDAVYFIELQGERIETIDVVVFPEDDIYLREGDVVEITGTVEEYQGKKEVIASSITLK